jgi:hypothetical protein
MINFYITIQIKLNFLMIFQLKMFIVVVIPLLLLQVNINLNYKDNGRVFGFGYNKYGQLGLNDSNDRNFPTEIKFFENKDIKKIISGFDHTFVITSKIYFLTKRNWKSFWLWL